MVSTTHHSSLPDYNYLVCNYCSDAIKGNSAHTLLPVLGPVYWQYESSLYLRDYLQPFIISIESNFLLKVSSLFLSVK